MRGCLYFAINAVYLAIRIVNVIKLEKVVIRQMMSFNLVHGSVLWLQNLFEKNNSSQSRIREEDDVEVHVFEEEEGDSSQNCHPLEVPPLV